MSYCFVTFHRNARTTVIVGLVGLLAALLLPSNAYAIASMSRMYNMGCKACHGAVPRINYFGEKFLIRGYELDRMTPADLAVSHVAVDADTKCTTCHNPGAQGDEVTAARIASADLFLHKVSNYFSGRIKFTPLQVDTNAMKVGSDLKSRMTIGKGNYFQLWFAAPIMKNVALRAEAQLSDGAAIDLHNFAIAFSNLFHSNGKLNLRAGGFSHGEWLSISDQKRAFDPHFDIYTLKSARGRGADTYTVGGTEPAIEVYGTSGPVVYQVGTSTGKTSADLNNYRNYWGTLKLYLATAGELAGSSVSGQYLTGTDASAAATQTDAFDRYVFSGNIRWRSADLMGTFVRGTDDNWDLATGFVNKFKGGFAQALVDITPKTVFGAIYQRVSSDDKTINTNHTLLGVNYYMRQNTFVSAYIDLDLLGTSTLHPDKKHKFVVQFRSNF